MRSLLTILTIAAIVFSCGEAGVQVRVGDDYVSTFGVTNQADVTSYSANSIESDINSELKEFGAFIDDVDVESMTITLENYTGSATGDIDVIIDGNVIPFENVDFTSTIGVSLTDATQLEPIARLIENKDIFIAVDLTTNTPLGDDDFNVVVTLSVFGTAKED